MIYIEQICLDNIDLHGNIVYGYGEWILLLLEVLQSLENAKWGFRKVFSCEAVSYIHAGGRAELRAAPDVD